uniref:Soluble scavenger receptor cysteine-rich domain-containing protein SSC5D n=1 Tax=Chrysemys picta bellii TaxID=8478 RepID=A0A8C3FTK8_CHRPI
LTPNLPECFFPWAFADAGISEVAQIRLANGPNHCAGRVEVLHNQQWGTVCDYSWDLQDAGVVCRQLGCGTALSAPGGAQFGRGSDRIWLADVNCRGTEVALSDCRARPWGDSNCTHGEDASVVCTGNLYPSRHCGWCRDQAGKLSDPALLFESSLRERHPQPALPPPPSSTLRPWPALPQCSWSPGGEAPSWGHRVWRLPGKP